MKRLLIINFFVLTLIFGSFLPNTAFAGWLEQNWNNMVSTSVSAPDMIQKQGSGAYYGGGFTYSTGGTVTTRLIPVDFKMPSISAGCGGIDITAGAFDYNIEELITFLKQLISQAPGYSFQLAMQIFCPSCLDILNTLNQTSAMINGLQMDSCSVLQGLTDMASSAANKAIDKNLSEGSFFSYRKSMTDFNDQAQKSLKKFFTDVKAKLNCATKSGKCQSIEFLEGKKTFLEGVFEKIEENTTDASLKAYFKGNYPQLFKALIGDIRFIEINAEDEKGYNLKLDHINPIYEGSEKEILNLMISGTIDTMPAKGETLTYEKTVEIRVMPLVSADYTRVATFNTFSAIAFDTIESAKPKYQLLDRTLSLTSEELSFFSTLKTPVLRTLNVLFIDDELPKTFLDKLKPLAGVQLNYEVITIVAKNMQLAINQYKEEITTAGLYTDEIGNSISTIRANMAKLQKIAYDQYIEQYIAFEERVKELGKDGISEKMKNTRAAFMSRHPVAGALVFAGGISK